MKRRKLSPTMPGDILLYEFLKPMKISQYKLAKAIQVTQIRISQIIQGKRAITPDTALRLGRYFNTTAEFWINMQAGYDLKIARQKIGDRINKTIRPAEEAA
jgi:addiction module HigA family antidote